MENPYPEVISYIWWRKNNKPAPEGWVDCEHLPSHHSYYATMIQPISQQETENEKRIRNQEFSEPKD